MTSFDSVDFVIITALEEERNAVLRKIPNAVKLKPIVEDIRVYYGTTIDVKFPDSSMGFYNVILLPLLGMGRLEAAAATADAIRRWRPRYLLLVGIAGGIGHKGVQLGDLIVSNQIVDYELQKITPQGLQIRWNVHQADPRLLGAAQNLSMDAIDGLLTEERPKAGSSLARHFGPVASGDKVQAFGSVFEVYREKWPALIGVEMEAAGVTTASFQAPNPPGFLMIRAASDLADEEKNSEAVTKWRQYACDAAASCAIALLKSGPVTVSAVNGVSHGKTISGKRERSHGSYPLLSITDCESLTDLLVRSGKLLSPGSREAFLRRIGYPVGRMDFASSGAEDFARNLIGRLKDSNNWDCLQEIIQALGNDVHGPAKIEIERIRAALAEHPSVHE